VRVAHGADIAVKAQPAAVPYESWTGFYVGGNLGYAWGRADPYASYVADPAGNTVPAALASLNSPGAIGGAQLGYNARWGRFVYGGEIDFSWMKARKDGFVDPFWTTEPMSNNLALSSSYDWLATARLRAGVAVTPAFLAYVTGGLAMTRVTDLAAFSFPTIPSTSIWTETRTQFGAVVGGGIEYALSPNWSVKAEYLHAWFNDILPQWTTPGTVAGSPVAFEHSMSVVRGGLNYRLDPGPRSAYAAHGVLPPAPMSWSGFYAGLNAGYVRTQSNTFATADNQCPALLCLTMSLPKLSSRGFIGGGQLGHNWQAGAFVVGGEVDFSGLSGKAEATAMPLFVGAPDTGTFASRYDWLATARLRAGVSVTPDWLVYATGGLAVAHVEDAVLRANITIPNFPREILYARTDTLYGAVIGGGLEYAFSRNWSVRAEYLHAQFNKSAPQQTTIGAPPPYGFDHRLDMVRLGVNYRID